MHFEIEFKRVMEMSRFLIARLRRMINLQVAGRKGLEKKQYVNNLGIWFRKGNERL